MNNFVIFSSRQLAHISNMANKLTGVNIIVVMSERERQIHLTTNPNCLFDIKVVDIDSNDGVLWVYNEEQCASIISELSELPVALLTLDEGNLLLCAKLRERFNIPGPRVIDITPYRDKLAMKAIVSRRTAWTPRCQHVNDSILNRGYKRISKDIAAKMVAKPASSAGSNNVAIIRDERSFNKIISQCLTEEEDYEIEEYIEGSHYHCDTIFSGDECVFAACTEYASSTLNFQSGFPLGGRVLDPSSDISKRLVAEAIPIVKELGVGTIAQHTEFIVKKDGSIFFLESGGRPPGMFVVQAYEQAFKINFVELVVNEVLESVGLPQPALNNRSSGDFQSAFYLVYPKEHGYVKSLVPPPTTCEAEVQLTHVCEVGDLHDGCRSNIDFNATVLSKDVPSCIDQVYQQMKIFKPVNYESL